MRNIFEQQVMDEIIDRINNLTPSSKRQWGKMEVSQMLAHCSTSLRFATGERKPTKLFLIVGKAIGAFFKSTYYNEQPFKKIDRHRKHQKLVIKEIFTKKKNC